MKPERWQLVEKLYYEALEHKSEERREFLAQACAGDEELHRELAALLKYDDLVGSFIERPAFELEARARIAETSPEESGPETIRSPIPAQIGTYTLLGPLGKGGMGEVHLALDTRLNRKVAIKLLPSKFTADSERVRRFEQEARAASALNHPNIITIHEIGQHEGTHYLVTEFIDGETLRQRMARDQQRIRLTEVLEITAQIAAALHAAHEAGIIHRDIKPENVMVRSTGMVKVLDFGLAKLNPEDGSHPPESMTQSGIVMGTVRYMSPEQVRGKKVDRRADIFSLGVVLYEMLAGRRPFDGESSSDVIAAVLRNEPALLSEIAPNAPVALQRIVMRCLESKPEKRFQSAGDLSFALEALISPSEARTGVSAAAPPGAEANSSVPTPLRRLSQGWMAWIVAGVLALAVIWLTVAYFKRPAAEVMTDRFSIPLPEEITQVGYPAISPDGRRLVFTATTKGGSLLWVRPLDSLTAKVLPGTEDADSPFWSPDSQFIGFFAQGKLKKIAVVDGALTTLCDAKGASGTWNRDGVILFAPDLASEVYRVSAAGGTPVAVIRADRSRKEERLAWPWFLPDGRRFVFLVSGPEREKAGIYLSSLDGGEVNRLVAADSNVVYAPSADRQQGYLLFVRDRTLLAQPFDAANGKVTGEPLRIADQIWFFGMGGGRAHFSVSDDGVLVYRLGEPEFQQLGWYDRAGKPLSLVGSPGMFLLHKLSRDEKWVAVPRFDMQTKTFDIWLFDLVRGIESRFTFDPGTDQAVVWSPDGSQLVWASNREGSRNLYQKALSSTGQDTLLLKSDEGKYPNDWSRDGQFILYVETNPKTHNDIWVLPLSGDRQPFRYVHTPFDDGYARFSPKSKWIAYSSNESGDYEVYVQPFPATGDRWRISNRGGNHPLWRGDGKELFYIAADGKMMAVAVKSGASFEARIPRALFDYRSMRGHAYEVTGDGQRFLIATRTEETSLAPFTVVLNWTAEVKR